MIKLKNIKVNSKKKFEKLCQDIINGTEFFGYFELKNETMLKTLLNIIGIDEKKFKEKNYWYNQERKIHISSSQFGYILISTVGLIAYKPDYDDDKGKFFSALWSQYQVLGILIDKIENIKNDSFNIDGFNYEYLSNLSIGFFNNVLFYFELLCKFYITNCNEIIIQTHEISILLQQVKKVMFKNKQNDSFFHEIIVSEIERIAEYTKKIPGKFKEQYVKYNDNLYDSTCISVDSMNEFRNFVEISFDVMNRFNIADKNPYTQQGWYVKKILAVKDENEREELKQKYKYLIEQN